MMKTRSAQVSGFGLRDFLMCLEQIKGSMKGDENASMLRSF